MSSAINIRAWDTMRLCVSPTRLMARQHFQEDKEALPREDCYGCKERGHKIESCPYMNNEASMTSSKRLTGKQGKHDMKASSKDKHRICYTCRSKGYFSKDCPMGNTPKPNLVNNDFYLLRKDKNGTCASKVIGSPHGSTKAIWVPKSLVTKLDGSNMSWIPKYG